jgi:V8-like Glu-specific endopeptidase
MNIKSYTRSILNYWTPERMASAQPLDVLINMSGSHSLNATNDTSFGTNDKRTLSQSSVPGVPPRFLRGAPAVVGKLYGKMNGGHYMCSGSVIVSDNRDTLLTAGHCVFDANAKRWASEIIFIPEYSRGSRPRGTWVWRKAAALSGWTNHRNFNSDVAVVLVRANDGRHIQDVTGALGMTKHFSRQAWTNAYGYPGNMENGETRITCSGQSRPATADHFDGSELSCGMGGGSSGGPWTQGDYQTSVNSFTVSNRPNVMFGPYFGDAVWDLWAQLKNQ